MNSERKPDRSGKAESLTTLETLNLAAEYLNGKDVPSPRLNAEHLLAKVLGCNRIDLYIRFDEILTENQKNEYRSYLQRRAGRYPLQYIMGETDFHGKTFKLNQRVFIPRQETELLVEWVDEIMGGKKGIRFLEFGTGSGVISVSVASAHPTWRGIAFDVSEESVFCARENISGMDLEERVSLYVSDSFDSLGDKARFQLLLSNPPYIASGEIEGLQPEVSRFEEHTALNGGREGLDFYPLIARAGKNLLCPGGVVVLEMGCNQAGGVIEILKQQGFRDISIRKDYQGLDRLVKGVLPEDSEGG